MHGKVMFWKRDFANPKQMLFGWGFIGADENGHDVSTGKRIYFNQNAARYNPVKQGDVVEFELFEPRDNSPHRSRSAFKVEKVESDVT